MKHLHIELLDYSTQMHGSGHDARISNILIFMCHVFHQTNKSFYLNSLIFHVVSMFFKYESGFKKTDMHVVSRQHSIAEYAKITRSFG